MQTKFCVQTRKLCYKSVIAKQNFLKHGYTSFSKQSKMAEKVWKTFNLINRKQHQVKEIILHNCLNSLKDVAREVHISDESVRSILVDILVMRRVNARIVPKELNFLQKQYRE